MAALDATATCSEHTSTFAAASVLCPFTILRDKAEKAPWFFRGLQADASQDYRPINIETQWHSLGNGQGDYTIAGAEHSDPDIRWRVSVERKSLSDFYGTVLSGRDRFKVELDNLNRMESASVVVEAELSEISLYTTPHWSNRPAINQKSVIRSIAKWQLQFPRVHWWFCPGRRAAECWTFRLLQQFWKECMQ
jgi:hypothetical protein